VPEIPPVPGDLIAARRAFLAAGRECEAIAARMPTGTQIIAGIKPDEGDVTALDEARARQRDAAAAIFGHAWWSTAGNRVEAEKHLRAVADAGEPGR
jgi:hypothetical protein